MTGEQWRPIPGWEGMYEISDRGNARSLDRVSGRGHNIKGKAMTLQERRIGRYLWFAMSRKEGRQPISCHAAVLAAFVGPRPEGADVRHLNGDPHDNRLENLTYGTRSENMIDAIRHGTHPTASKTQCKHGHPFSEANTYYRKHTPGRKCRTCMRKRSREVELRRQRGPRRQKEAA